MVPIVLHMKLLFERISLNLLKFTDAVMYLSIFFLSVWEKYRLFLEGWLPVLFSFTNK